MGSSAGRVFNIAENIGLLKHKMWKAGITFITPAPTQVKKHFTGKGNARKELMYQTLTEQQPDVKLTDLLKCKEGDSPISDIVDSYAMVSFYRSVGV
jgi:Holliday junction resolvasome RuvABC endonuclease subunit